MNFWETEKVKAENGKFFLFLIFFFFVTPFSFARELSATEQKALSALREIAFEITRYNATGLSSLPQSAGLSLISRVGSNLLSLHKVRDSVQNPVYLCEFYFPEKIGVIDSTFCPEDLYVTNDFFAGIEHVEAGEEDEENLPEFDWIDVILQSFNAPSSSNSTASAESFGILDGEKILEMLENNNSRGIEAQNEAGKIDSEVPQEYSYTKKDGSLRRFSYDGEQFSLATDGDDTVLVNFYGDKLIRKRFDPLYRLVKDERFKTTASAKNMSLETETDYEYAGDSNLLQKMIEEQFSAKKRLERHFDEGGRNTFLLESHYEEREIKSKKKKKDGEAEKETILVNDKQASKSYDDKGRVAEEEIITWSYKTNSFGREITEKREIKNVYDYSAVTDENKLPPSVQFFEDGELHLERIYTGASDYSEKLYFDGGFSVELLYEGGVKKTEIIYLNDVEQRRREFEY